MIIKQLHNTPKKTNILAKPNPLHHPIRPHPDRNLTSQDHPTTNHQQFSIPPKTIKRHPARTHSSVPTINLTQALLQSIATKTRPSRRPQANSRSTDTSKDLPRRQTVHMLATLSEKLRVATLHGRLPTSPGSLAHNRLSHTRPVRYETFLSNLRILRKTSNAAQAALRHSHPFLTLAKRIGLEPKHIP